MNQVCQSWPQALVVESGIGWCKKPGLFIGVRERGDSGILTVADWVDKVLKKRLTHVHVLGFEDSH